MQVDQPVAFGRNHKVDASTAASWSWMDWLRRFGWVSHVSGNAAQFIMAREGAVVGYYTLLRRVARRSSPLN